ncbi:sodium:solute symporter family protein [Bacillus sp. 1P06AnD]|uniref:sodium:solute symporter family protein n=1 Tax=Bacillus sp. 1P06AnD TaxID=3132208 RepID=UPI0039A2A2B3
MNTAVIVIVFFLLLSIYWALKSSRGQGSGIEQWALGGRSMGTIITFFLLAGEFFTTFTLTGLVGLAYSGGPSAYYIMSYIALGCIVGFWILPAIRRYSKKHKLLSQADFFMSKYDSPLLGKIVTIVGVVSMVPMMVIALKGLGLIVSVASFGAISPTVAIWGGVIAVVIYTLISGLHGSSRVALVKDVMTFGVLVFLGIYIPFHYSGGISPVFKQLSESAPDILTLKHTGASTIWFISTIILNTIGFFMWPNSFLSTFSAKSDKALRKNTMLLPLYSLMQLFACMVGFTALLVIPGLVAGQSDLALVNLIIQTFNPWFVGVVGAIGLLGALVPCSVYLIAASSMLTKNIYAAYAKNTSDKHLGKVARNFTILLAIISLYLALHSSGALNLLFLMSYNFITQLAPALYCSLTKNNFITKSGAISGMIVGILVAIYVGISSATTATLFPALPDRLQDINIGLFIVLLNILTMIAVSLIDQLVQKFNQQEEANV